MLHMHVHVQYHAFITYEYMFASNHKMHAQWVWLKQKSSVKGYVYVGVFLLYYSAMHALAINRAIAGIM